MEEQKGPQILELEGLRGFRASGNKIGNHLCTKNLFLQKHLSSMLKDARDTITHFNEKFSL